MRLYVVQTDSSGSPPAPGEGAEHGRAAAMSRRRALAAGRTALAPAAKRAPAAFPEAPVGVSELAADPGPFGAPPGGTAVAINRAVDAHLGRTLSMQRRRQLAKGKRALNGGDTPAVDSGEPATFVVHRGGAR